MSQPRRQIRTLSQLNEKQPTEPHRIFMKISTLEMEKNRRQQERAKAMERIHTIDNRIQNIEAEVAELLSLLDLPNQNKPAPAEQKPAKKTSAKNFVLKY